MIITLAKADFSKNNIGVLNSFVVLTDLAAGLVYNGVTAPEKNQPFSASVAINPGYALDEIVVSMGGVILEDACMITSNGVLIEIPSVTGMIVITASSYSTTEPATITYNYVDTEGNVLRAATTESATKGTTREFVATGKPWVAGYDMVSVNPETATIKNDIEVNYVYDTNPNMADGYYMLAVNATPADAMVNCYLSGATATDDKQRIICASGKSPSYQVYKDGYLSQGGQFVIKENTTLDIELKPFSDGNWEQIDLTGDDVFVLNDYFITNAGKKTGPYNTWESRIVPAEPNTTYRATALAGQSAVLWGAYQDFPDYDNGTIQPLAYSKNTGMSVKISEEFTTPANTNYLVINCRKDSGYLNNILKLEKLVD